NDYLYCTGQCRRALIAAPLSTLTCVWENEIFENFPHLSATVLHGDKNRRLRLLGEEADIYIINHDGVEVLHQALWERRDIDTIIVDELAIYRNSRSLRWKNLSRLRRELDSLGASLAPLLLM